MMQALELQKGDEVMLNREESKPVALAIV